MANTQWPTSLQDHPNIDYSEKIMDGVIRSNPAVGPSMSRPRFTKTRTEAAMTIWVNKTQYEEFFNWYDVLLAQGSLPFDWEKPITNVPATFKFMAAPSVSAVGPLTWTISCQLEQLL
jgi:hypothetical protein